MCLVMGLMWLVMAYFEGLQGILFGLPKSTDHPSTIVVNMQALDSSSGVSFCGFGSFHTLQGLSIFTASSRQVPGRCKQHALRYVPFGRLDSRTP